VSDTNAGETARLSEVVSDTGRCPVADVLDEAADVLDRCLRDEPVPDVEDVAGATARAVEHVVDPQPELSPWREQGHRIEVALHGSFVPDDLPRLVQRQLPVEADDVAAASGGVVEVGAHPEREIDHRHTRARDRGEELTVRRGDVAEVVVTPERPPGPGVEHLQHLSSRARLRQQVVGLDRGELRHEPLPRRGLGEHERLRLREVPRRRALERVARERERRPREADHGNVTRLEFGPDEPNRLERAGHGLVRRRHPEHVDVAPARDRVRDSRAVALDEVQVEPHADERREDVREDDRRVDAERVDRKQRHLGGKVRRVDEVEQRVAFAQSAVLRHVPAGLSQEPDRRSVGRKAAACAKERRRRLGVVS
jgi:hypothetical protein